MTTSLFGFFIENGLINKSTEAILKYLSGRIEQYRRGGSAKKAMAVLNKRLKGKEGKNEELRRLLSPYILTYLCGLGLGDLKNIIETFTKDFPAKKILLELLTDFNYARIDIIHKATSNRIILPERVEDGLKIGRKILEFNDLLGR